MIHPTTGELLPDVRPGVTVWSKSRKYNDDVDYQSPIGGYLIDIHTLYDDERDDNNLPALVVTEYRVVDWRFGRAWYWQLPDIDIDWDAYSGGVNTANIRKFAERLMQDQLDHKQDHMHALLALSNAMVNR